LGKALNATFSILEPSSLSAVVARSDKSHANRTALRVGSDKTDTEHNERFMRKKILNLNYLACKSYLVCMVWRFISRSWNFDWERPKMEKNLLRSFGDVFRCRSCDM